MTLTLGRFSTSEDPDAETLRHRGDEVSFESMIVASSMVEYAARVQQLRGLVDNPDERVFPATWSEDSTFDGFYTDVDVEVQNEPATYAAFSAPFRVRMRRVSPVGYAPVQECPGVILTRTNSHGIGAGQDGQWSVPASASAASPPDGASKDLAVATRTADTGVLRTFFFSAASTGVQSGKFIVAPAAHYVGASHAECKGSSGSTFYQLQGRQAALSTSNWRLNNGLVRVAAPTAAGLFSISCFDGTSWSTPVDITCSWRSQVVSDALLATADTPTIERVVALRVTPELSVLRLYWRWTNTSIGGSFPNPTSTLNQLLYRPRTLDISLRRGDHIATVSTSDTPVGFTALTETGGAASTAITGGLRVTANDASGNRLVLVAANATLFAVTASSLRVTRSSTYGCVWGVGYEIDGNVATGMQVAQQVAYQFFVPYTEQQRVIAG